MSITQCMSVVLCTTGNRLDELKKNLISISQQEVKTKLIVVCQCNDQKRKRIEEIINKVNIKADIVSDYGKGLSRARNLAIKQLECSKGFLIFADDDNWYPNEAFKEAIKIAETYNSDIYTFKYYDKVNDVFPKKYRKRKKNLNYINLNRVSSIEIMIDLEKVTLDKIYFDENLGIGTDIPSGEENQLLFRLKKCGYNIMYYPFIFSYHPYKKNKRKIDGDFFSEKKQLFYKIYGKRLGRIMYILFFIKKKMKL